MKILEQKMKVTKPNEIEPNFKCKKCNWKWFARVKEPKQCPACHRVGTCVPFEKGETV